VKQSAASVGGLSGFMLDVRLAAGYLSSCAGVPLIHASGGYDQMIGPGSGTLIRLYLLGLAASGGPSPVTLAIEVDDHSDGSHMDSLAAVVKSMHFTP